MSGVDIFDAIGGMMIGFGIATVFWNWYLSRKYIAELDFVLKRMKKKQLDDMIYDKHGFRLKG